VAPQELLDYMVPQEQQPSAYRHILKIMLLIGGVLALGALWRWTPAGKWLDMQSAKAVGQWIRQQPFTPALVVLAYVLGTLIGMLPGMVATIILADRLAVSLSQPDLVNVATLGGFIVLTIIAIPALRRWIKQKRTSASDSVAETSR
jgi:sulfite exporter TauE/SafE